MQPNTHTVIASLFLMSLYSGSGYASTDLLEDSDEDSDNVDAISHAPPFYRNPEERREAGLGTQVTDWLKLSGLLEVEREVVHQTFNDNSRNTEKDPLIKNVQLAMDMQFGEDVEAELVFEIEREEKTRILVDEAAVSWDVEDWSLTAGRYSVPFGEYYSHFVMGPVLEVGETRATAISVDYSFSDTFEVGLFIFNGEVDPINGGSANDWGAMLEWTTEDESVRLGASYLSDLAESDEKMLADEGQRYINRVDAISAYALIGFEQMEVSVEMVKALDRFAEFDTAYDQPEAYNAEVAYFPQETWQVALRYERIIEVEDEGRDRYGLGFRWLVLPNVSIAADYLIGQFSHMPPSIDEVEDLEEEASEPMVTDTRMFAFQISVEF